MFYWVSLGFTGFLLGFTGFHWVLLGFTGFYWVLLSWTEFLPVRMVKVGLTTVPKALVARQRKRPRWTSVRYASARNGASTKLPLASTSLRVDDVSVTQRATTSFDVFDRRSQNVTLDESKTFPSSLVRQVDRTYGVDFYG